MSGGFKEGFYSISGFLDFVLFVLWTGTQLRLFQILQHPSTGSGVSGECVVFYVPPQEQEP